MANRDIDSIRGAIAEKRGLRPRRRPPRLIRGRRRHRPFLRPAPRTPGEFVLALTSLVMTFAALVFALSAGQLAGFWIGDHAQHHGREWPVFRALGFKPMNLGGHFYMLHAITEEFRLLPWLVVVAAVTSILARPYQAVLVAFGAGLVTNGWAGHLPSFDFPSWFGRLVDKQRTLQEHVNPWQMFAVFVGLALITMAWAERTQAT